MYTYDEIIASGYYIFLDDLSTDIVSEFIYIMKKLGKKFSRNELKLNKVLEILDFDGTDYRLNNDKNYEDIMQYVNLELVLVFECIQIDRNNCQSIKIMHK